MSTSRSQLSIFLLRDASETVTDFSVKAARTAGPSLARIV